ncbi:MAG TPA: hypothetical protein DCW68_03070 [Rhodospirillaceae bacterium]|nr:MAG: hypothetical protein A2018_06045 [Alphaproteobacteria bacterium GWF2_58_20]HAU29073.1 hypothetical protein [Rhodospirillaceae bacterium]
MSGFWKEDSEKTIFDVVMQGDVARLRTLLDESPELCHAQDEEGNVAMHWVAEFVHDEERAGKMMALMAGLDKTLLNARNRVGETPTHRAVLSGNEAGLVALFNHQETIPWLLDNRGDSPYARAPMRELVIRGILRNAMDRFEKRKNAPQPDLKMP